MTLDDLIPPHVTATVRAAGLHKVAGAMLGVPELTVKEAMFVLGAKAYLRRKEARSIADGIAAYASLTGEKIAENPAMMAMLRRAAMPALMGAGIAAAPQLLSNDPMQQHQSMLPALGMGALMGGSAGMLRSVHGLPEGLNQDLAQALR